MSYNKRITADREMSFPDQITFVYQAVGMFVFIMIGFFNVFMVIP